MPDPNTDLIDRVADWVYARILAEDNAAPFLGDAASWEALHDVCDPNDFIVQASTQFGRPCTEAHFWFWNAVSDAVSDLLAERHRRDRDVSFAINGFGGWAIDTRYSSSHSAASGGFLLLREGALNTPLTLLYAPMLDYARDLTCSEADAFASLLRTGSWADHLVEAFLRRHAEPDDCGGNHGLGAPDFHQRVVLALDSNVTPPDHTDPEDTP